MREQSPIYLDHNATTPLAAEVLDAMLPYLRERFGNPSSSHAYGQTARAAVEAARAEVAALIGAHADEVIFTAGGTEANNLAIRGAAAAIAGRRRLVTSAIEHPAVAAPMAALERDGYQVARLPVAADGRVRLDAAKAAIDHSTALVSVMHANNETGVLQPVAALADRARAHGALMHSDAAQSVGKVAVNVDELGVDLLSLAGHKFYGPKGVGALYVRRGTPLQPVLFGAGHERGLRPGTENVAAIIGLAAAGRLAARELDEATKRQAELRDRLWTRLRDAIPGVVLHGEASPCLPNTLSVRFPNVVGAELLAAAPTVAASTGSACHAGDDAAGNAITAMGVSAAAARGTVRLSLGRSTTVAEVDAAAVALIRAAATVASHGGSTPST